MRQSRPADLAATDGVFENTGTQTVLCTADGAGLVLSCVRVLALPLATSGQSRSAIQLTA